MPTYRITLAVDIEAGSDEDAYGIAGRLSVAEIGDPEARFEADIVSIEDEEWNEI
jgi:hypothetical protein